MMDSMADTTTDTTARGKSGYPRLHTIQFVDSAKVRDDVPVHVTRRVLINGNPVTDPNGLRIRNDLPLTVETNGGLTQSEALVSFVIHADDVRMPNYDRDGRTATPDDHPLIGDYEPLIPPGDDTTHRWEEEEAATTLDGEVIDGPYVRVWFMAHTILFTPHPEETP